MESDITQQVVTATDSTPPGKSADAGSILHVTVDKASPDGKQFYHFSNTSATAVFTLRIPNRLLHHWHGEMLDKENQCKSTSYITLLNSEIQGGVVNITPTCSRIERRLCVQASKVSAIISKGGRKAQTILHKEYHLFVLEGEAESIKDIREMKDAAEMQAALWKHQHETKQLEVTQLLEDMAESIITYEEMMKRLEARIEDSEATVARRNDTKTVEEVSPRQARRKMSQFTSYVHQALWFSESFGLIPEYVHLRKTKSGSPVKVPFSPSNLRISSEQPTADDHEKVLQTLYILDRFAVSDESYHELGTLSGTLPPLYKVKKARNIINESLEIERLPSPYLGAFRPFYNTLLKELTKAVSYKLMSSSLASVWYIRTCRVKASVYLTPINYASRKINFNFPYLAA